MIEQAESGSASVNGCQEPLFLGFESADLVQQV